MGGLLGNTKVARRAPPAQSQCDLGGVPGYGCRDYGRGYPQRGGSQGLPCHMGSPGYDPYHYPPALPSVSQDLGYGEEAENWSESTLIYFGVGLVTIAILSKFIQDLLRSPQPRARTATTTKSAIFTGPEADRVISSGGGEKAPILSMNDLFYGEPETVVILKTDDRKVIDNIHQYKYFGVPPDEKPAPKAAEPVKQPAEGKKKQKKEEAKKEEVKKDDPPKEEAKEEPKKEDGSKEEPKKEDAAKEDPKKAEAPKEEPSKVEATKEEAKKDEAPKAESKPEEKKEEPAAPPPPERKKVLLKVPMCCTECELTAQEALNEISGVVDVECDYHDEKVTVTIIGDVPAADLLLKCRSLKLFRKSDYWKG